MRRPVRCGWRLRFLEAPARAYQTNRRRLRRTGESSRFGATVAYVGHAGVNHAASIRCAADQFFHFQSIVAVHDLAALSTSSFDPVAKTRIPRAAPLDVSIRLRLACPDGQKLPIQTHLEVGAWVLIIPSLDIPAALRECGSGPRERTGIEVVDDLVRHTRMLEQTNCSFGHIAPRAISRHEEGRNVSGRRIPMPLSGHRDVAESASGSGWRDAPERLAAVA